MVAARRRGQPAWEAKMLSSVWLWVYRERKEPYLDFIPVGRAENPCFLLQVKHHCPLFSLRKLGN